MSVLGSAEDLVVGKVAVVFVSARNGKAGCGVKRAVGLKKR